MNLELTPEQVEELNNTGSITITIPPKPEKWEPEGGEYYMHWCNTAGTGATLDRSRIAGRERANKALAERAAQASRERDRLEAFRDQYWPDWVADWDDEEQEKWCVEQSGKKHFLSAFTWEFRKIGTVYGPKEFAKRAAKMLNSGEMKL